MAMEDWFKSTALGAVATGVGLAAAAPLVLRYLSGDGRSLAKICLHRYLDLRASWSEMTAETREQWLDLMAEVEAERAARAGAASMDDENPDSAAT